MSDRLLFIGRRIREENRKQSEANNAARTGGNGQTSNQDSSKNGKNSGKPNK